jgi:hypothetical protein
MATVAARSEGFPAVAPDASFFLHRFVAVFSAIVKKHCDNVWFFNKKMTTLHYE